MKLRQKEMKRIQRRKTAKISKDKYKNKAEKHNTIKKRKTKTKQRGNED